METYVKMAAPCVRTMSSLLNYSRGFMINRAQLRPRNLVRFSSKAEAESAVKDQPSENKETEGSATNNKEVTEIKDQLDKITKEKEELNINLSDLKDKYMRSLAETENLRTRMKKQVEDAKVFGIQGFCKDLLEVADILNKATESTPVEEVQKNQHLKDLFDGLNMTNTQLLKVFSKHGLVKIQPEEGEKFDPFFHEALFEVPLPEGKEGGTVAIIQKTGFKLHDRTIRPALVGVFKSS